MRSIFASKRPSFHTACDPETAILQGTFYLGALKTAAAKLSVEPQTANVRNAGEIEAALAELGQDAGLIVAPETFTEVHREFIVDLAAGIGFLRSTELLQPQGDVK